MSDLLLKSFLWGLPEHAAVLLLLKAFVCSEGKAEHSAVEGLREQKEGLVLYVHDWRETQRENGGVRCFHYEALTRKYFANLCSFNFLKYLELTQVNELLHHNNQMSQITYSALSDL